MVDSLILILFVISGAAAGWLGVDLLPEQLLLQVDKPEGLRTVLGGFGAFFGVIAGVFFQQLRRKISKPRRIAHHFIADSMNGRQRRCNMNFRKYQTLKPVYHLISVNQYQTDFHHTINCRLPTTSFHIHHRQFH